MGGDTDAEPVVVTVASTANQSCVSCGSARGADASYCASCGISFRPLPQRGVSKRTKAIAATVAFVAAIVAFLICRQIGTVLVGREDAAAVAGYFGLGVFPISYPWLSEKLTARQLGSRRSQLPPSVFHRAWFVAAALTGLLLAAVTQVASFAIGLGASLLVSLLIGGAPEMGDEFLVSLLAGSWVVQIIVAFFLGRDLGANIERRHAWGAIPLMIGVAIVAVLVIDRLAILAIGMEAAPPDFLLVAAQVGTWLVAATAGYLSGPRLSELAYLVRVLPTMQPTDREALVALTYAHASEAPADETRAAEGARRRSIRGPQAGSDAGHSPGADSTQRGYGCRASSRRLCVLRPIRPRWS